MNEVTIELLLIPLPSLGLRTRSIGKKRVTRVGHLLLHPMYDMRKFPEYTKALTELGLTFETPVPTDMQAEFEATEAQLRKLVCGLYWHFQSACMHCQHKMWIEESKGAFVCSDCDSESATKATKGSRQRSGTHNKSYSTFHGSRFD